MPRTKVFTDEETRKKNAAYRQRWQKENRDRLNVQVVKGQRDVLRAYALAHGYAGYAEYIYDLVRKDSGINLMAQPGAGTDTTP